MDVQEIRTYCLAKNQVTEDMPFGENVLVFRIGGKIFLLTDLESTTTSINLKCDPLRAQDLREQYPQITPGYHMNKKHWNTVLCDDLLPKSLILELIDHSHELVLKSLPAKQKRDLLE